MSAIGELNERADHDWDRISYSDAHAFSTAEGPSLKRCLQEVGDSSYFLLIVGWRYGHVPEGEEKSIVELEYEAALKANIPRFCFFLDSDYPVAAKFIEVGEGAEKLERFKRTVEKNNVAVRFTTPEDLAREVTLAFATLKRPLQEAAQSMFEHSILDRQYRKCRREVDFLRESVESYRSKLARIVPADPIWRARDFDRDDTLCFVLMPFDEKHFVVYEEAIEFAARRAGLRTLHAGEIFGTREVMEDIWESISSSRLIVADVTGRNPNVFYELGIAHTLGKECIVITQDAKDVPFDISSRRYIKYEPEKLASLRERLEKTIKAVLL